MSTGLKLVLVGAQILTVASALLVAFHPNVLRASIALLFAFLGVAVLFVFLGADFLAGAQVVIYVGGVTILILFAIMLTQWLYQVKLRDLRNELLIPLVVIGAGTIPALYKVLHELAVFIQKTPLENAEKFANSPKTATIGTALLSSYVLPFEAVTILLLGALVGAVWLARPK